jgi:hypothetical protein
MALFEIGHSLFVVFLMIFPDGNSGRADGSRVDLLECVISCALDSSLIPLQPLQHPGNGISACWRVFDRGEPECPGKAVYNAQQVKWVLFGLFAALAGFLVMLPPVFFPALVEPTPLGVVYELVGSIVSLIAMSMIPLAIVFSALHYRLWQVDFVINRSLVYGGLTVLLGVFFALDVLIIQWLAQRITGQDQVPLAFAISAVLVGATFQPVRLRLQRLIDQRLYGIQVDYRRGDTPGLAVGALVGTKIGPYEVQASIGRGGMAEVYRGIHPTLGRPWRSKFLPRLAVEADFRTRFERERRPL